MNDQDSTAPAIRAHARPYTTPVLEELGAVSRLTMGHGGSSLDGNCTYTQLGGGNDPDGGQNPQSCRK